MHYGQEIDFGFFGEYLTGLEKPHDFPISNVIAPISIHYSTYDKLADAQDVEQLILKLKNVIFVERIDEEFDHVDFLYSTHAASLVYSKILNIFQNYQ